jgi:hypothetical protein
MIPDSRAPDVAIPRPRSSQTHYHVILATRTCVPGECREFGATLLMKCLEVIVTARPLRRRSGLAVTITSRHVYTNISLFDWSTGLVRLIIFCRNSSLLNWWSGVMLVMSSTNRWNNPFDIQKYCQNCLWLEHGRGAAKRRPFPTHGQPSHTVITKLKEELMQIAVAIPTLLGGGELGHAGLIV